MPNFDATDEGDADPWVFGYGSLIWRPDFPFLDRKVARIDGYIRRFWQASPDHRGTPDRPGRVVTVIDAPGESTWGLAYRFAAGDRDALLGALDAREVAGYERLRVVAWDRQGRALGDVVTYRANPAHRCFVGPAPLEELLAVVSSAKGVSGSNVEYVVRLADALDELGIQDSHVSELAAAVRRRTM